MCIPIQVVVYRGYAVADKQLNKHFIGIKKTEVSRKYSMLNLPKNEYL